MGEHGVASNICWVPRDEKAMEFDSVGHVIVLTTPTPKLVAEAIDSSKLVSCHGTHSSKDVVVRQSVTRGVNALIMDLYSVAVPPLLM